MKYEHHEIACCRSHKFREHAPEIMFVTTTFPYMILIMI